jgi:hypothetical protein
LFRSLVAKHFLSTSLDQLHNRHHNNGTFGLKITNALQEMMFALRSIMKNREGNLGLKYRKVLQQKNRDLFYENTYLKQMLDKSERVEQRENIAWMITRMQMNQIYLSDWNVLFGRRTTKDAFFELAKQV